MSLIGGELVLVVGVSLSYPFRQHLLCEHITECEGVSNWSLAATLQLCMALNEILRRRRHNMDKIWTKTLQKKQEHSSPHTTSYYALTNKHIMTWKSTRITKKKRCEHAYELPTHV